MSVTIFAIALFAATPLADLSAVQLQPPVPASELAVQPLAAGRGDEAIAVLEHANAADPYDPAVLINLGIAYAQTGNEAKARTAFRQALANDVVVDLDTADGTATDSRRLARKALRMLESGELRAVGARGEQLTYRDR